MSPNRSINFPLHFTRLCNQPTGRRAPCALLLRGAQSQWPRDQLPRPCASPFDASRRRRRCNTKSSKRRWRLSVAGSRVDEWAPRGGMADYRCSLSVTDRGVRIAGHRDFLSPCCPRVVALFSRALFPCTCTKPPGLTGTTTLSRETAPTRAVSVFRTTATEELFLDTAGTNASCKKTAPETRQ